MMDVACDTATKQQMTHLVATEESAQDIEASEAKQLAYQLLVEIL